MITTLVIAKTMTKGRALANELGLEDAVVIAYDTSHRGLQSSVRGLRLKAIVFDDLRQALRDVPQETLDIIYTCQIW